MSTRHEITIDCEEPGDSALNAFRAYCTDECGWQAESWSHASDFYYLVDREAGAASDAAYNDAVDQGQDHLDSV